MSLPRVLDARLKTAICGDTKLYHAVNSVRSVLDRGAMHVLGEMQLDDSICDIGELRRVRNALDAGKIEVDIRNSELRNLSVYGIWNALFGRCGYRGYETPAVEHGLIFYRQTHGDTRNSARAASATFGRYRQEVIQSNVELPVFRVGPYIKYCNGFYEQDSVQNIKAKNGRTLLVFPTHGLDAVSIDRSVGDCIRAIRNEAKGFDSVLVCFYWWDINEPLVDACIAEGMQVVSAGLKYDLSFLPRLRTIIELADSCIGDSVGTNAGYCLALGKDFKIVDMASKTSIHGNLGIENSGESLGSIMVPLRNALSRDGEHIGKKIEVCEPYWGFSDFKAAEDMALICEITRNICELGRYKSRMYPMAARRLLGEYAETSREYQLLIDAMPRSRFTHAGVK